VYKTIIILYLVCFSCYIFFTRQPDFIDGDITTATIHYIKDSTGNRIPKALFSIGINKYTIDAAYLFRNPQEGSRVDVIYEASMPTKAKVYSWWGYWFKAEELIGSLVLFIVLFQIAIAVTKNPTAESLIEQLDYKPEKKRRYQD